MGASEQLAGQRIDADRPGTGTALVTVGPDQVVGVARWRANGLVHMGQDRHVVAKEAQQRYIDDGCVGVVVETPGQLVGCRFCECFDICTQKDRYIADGTLQL